MKELNARLMEIEARVPAIDREKKRNDEWWARYRAQAPVDLELPADTLKRANDGDGEARAQVTAALNRAPAFVAREGDFMARTEEALLNQTSGGDWTLREARKRVLHAMRDSIAGPTPSALEMALAHVVAMSLVEADDLATRALRTGTTDALDRRRTRAHARAMSAARTLATVRRLALPVVHVANVAANGSKSENPAQPLSTDDLLAIARATRAQPHDD